CSKHETIQESSGVGAGQGEGQVHVEMKDLGAEAEPAEQGARVEPAGQAKLRATRAGLKTSTAEQREQETPRLVQTDLKHRTQTKTLRPQGSEQEI
ncbi:hypothetical protein M9458_056594, partial [Cirrhinus mrigala]